MEQSTKLFVTLGFMFVIFTTLNGHLEEYLRILFGSTQNSTGPLDAKTIMNTLPNIGF